MAEIVNNPSPTRPSTPTGGSSSPATGAAANAASQAGDEAVAVKDRAVEAAGEVTERATQEAKQVAEEARHEARNVMHQVRGELDQQAGDAASRVASAIESAASELRAMADRADHPDAAVPGFVRDISERGTALARQIEERGYRGVADELSRFGRNRPGIFLVAAGVTGFAVGRILRNTDTGAVVDAVKDEFRGSHDDTTTTGDRTPAAATVTTGPVEEPYVPATTIGSGVGSL
jgi:vacuolar-type H+-ATPase subunit H